MSEKSGVSKKIQDIVEPIITGIGYELVEVEFVKEGSHKYLRLYIDKPGGGISIDDCQKVNDAVIDVIDEADPISEAYIFEVSSPGLDRPLKNEKDFLRHYGEEIEVGLYAPKDGCKSFEGILQSYNNGVLTIKTKKENIMEFDMKTVSVVKRVIKF